MQIGRTARIRATAGNFRIRAASGRASRRQQAGSRAMIDISESAQTHFRKLIERAAVPGMGVRLAARDPGTARADVRLEFAEPADLRGDEWAIDCEGFTLWQIGRAHV